jgi:hypothetical protein
VAQTPRRHLVANLHLLDLVQSTTARVARATHLAVRRPRNSKNRNDERMSQHFTVHSPHNDWDEPSSVFSPLKFIPAVLSTGATLILGVLVASGIVGAAPDLQLGQGLPLLLTAVGALAIAIAVSKKINDAAYDVDVASADVQLRHLMSQRPDDPNDVRADEFKELRASRSTAVDEARNIAVRARSISLGIELAGAVLLLCGAVLAAFVWGVPLR